MKKRLLPTRCHYQIVPAVLPSLLNCLLYVFALQSIFLSSKDGTSDDGIVCICPTRPLFAYLETHHCTYQPNPGAAGNFYTADYVLVSADQLILRANITKLSKLLEDISDMDRSIKAHLNTLLHSKTGKLMRGEEYSKSFDEEVIKRLNEAKEKVNSELKYLNDKHDQCKGMCRGVLLLKNKSKKRSQKQNKRKSKKRKQQRETNNFKLLHQLISADLNSDVIDNVNVEALASLSVRQVRWLTKMAKNGHLTERAIATAQDYLEGFMEKSEEELDTGKSLSGEDSDSLTENEECGGWSLNIVILNWGVFAWSHVRIMIDLIFRKLL